MINHRSNIQALADLDVEIIISICSSGALSGDIRVPSIAIPDDYIDLFSGATVHDEGIFHLTPGFDMSIQKCLEQACREEGMEPLTGITYVQTKGPRLETRAEVRVLSGWGDLVGMNLGPEATLSTELGIRFGSILTVDNHANGIRNGKLDFREIRTNAVAKWDKLVSILARLPGEI
jgi:5'-methylthioadenosine phosphorylase